LGIERTTGLVNAAPGSDSDSAPTYSNPVGSGMPSSVAARPATTTDAVSVKPPGPICTRSPDAAVISPPSVPTTFDTRGPTGGSSSSTLMTPLCKVTASNAREGETAYVAVSVEVSFGAW
jgi:hypothetical protein